MTIKEVSKKVELTADTLRYYERIGLIPPVKRNEFGNRVYTEEDCNWIFFAKHMRHAGMTIEKLIEYVKLFQEGDETILTRKQLLIEQYQQLGDKITELQATQERLKNKIERYEDHILKYENDKLKNQHRDQGS